MAVVKHLLPGTEVRITRTAGRRQLLRCFGQTWHANNSEQLSISRDTSGLSSLWIHSNSHLCLHHCCPEADPKSGCHKFWGNVSEQKCMLCNRRNASNLLFSQPLFKENKVFTFQSSFLFYCHMARLVQNPLTAQQDHFHTLYVHR